VSKQWNPEIKMELEHRGVVILKAALPALIKTLRKGAKSESQLFGTSVHYEAIDYCEHLQRLCDSALNDWDKVMTTGEV
jgi:hypothetical protein